MLLWSQGFHCESGKKRPWSILFKCFIKIILCKCYSYTMNILNNCQTLFIKFVSPMLDHKSAILLFVYNIFQSNVSINRAGDDQSLSHERMNQITHMMMLSSVFTLIITFHLHFRSVSLSQAQKPPSSSREAEENQSTGVSGCRCTSAWGRWNEREGRNAGLVRRDHRWARTERYTAPEQTWNTTAQTWTY